MSFWTDLKDFFFPRFCPSCGSPLYAGEKVLCLPCKLMLPRAGLYDVPGYEMERSFWGRFPIVRAASLFIYQKGGSVARILYAMKYRRRKQLCVRMGQLLADELLSTGFFEGVDCLLPVPLHRSRLRRRGYNQSELLAKGISLRTRIPLCTDAVCRVHHNESQTRKSKSGRWRNVEQLFQPTDRAALLRHTHVLLVDDVLTTGATLIACADALKEVEGVKFSVVTLAWAK